MADDDWFVTDPDGVVLRVLVGPGAKRSGVAGLHGAALRVRVKMAPEHGAGNRELPGALGVQVTAITVETGARSRRKRVRIRGITAETVRERLATVFVDTVGRHG